MYIQFLCWLWLFPFGVCWRRVLPRFKQPPRVLHWWQSLNISSLVTACSAIGLFPQGILKTLLRLRPFILSYCEFGVLNIHLCYYYFGRMEMQGRPLSQIPAQSHTVAGKKPRLHSRRLRRAMRCQRWWLGPRPLQCLQHILPLFPPPAPSAWCWMYAAYLTLDIIHGPPLGGRQEPSV